MLAPHAFEGREACEVNYRKKMCHSRSVRLDKDDTNGHGPETITIEKFNPGQYVLRVNEFNAGQYVLRVNEFHGDASNPKWGVSQAQAQDST
ncbi:hypothetical protein T484DRAFT_1852086 [Baffinella frigidus]|nr:hypothetical protein T484DRAFT_1852086 [Cryptophyta sp. CCMP2293]